MKQYITVTQDGVVGVSAADGGLLWRHKRDDPFGDVVCATPIVQADLVYVSVGYGGGGTCLKVTASGKKADAAVVYAEKIIGNKQGGVVRVGKYAYGYNEDRSWACQDFASGTVAWPKGRTRQNVKAGSLLAADGRLYVLDVEGKVSLLDATPTRFATISQFPLPALSMQRKSGGGVWTHPSLSDGKLYVRDQELIYCYQVK